MNVNLSEYKNEVGSLTLNAEFKEKLKQRCIEEAAASPADNIKKTAEIYSKVKAYKYIAVAACLVAAVSTIGTASLISSRLKTKADDSLNLSDSAAFNEKQNSEEADSAALDANGTAESDEPAYPEAMPPEPSGDIPAEDEEEVEEDVSADDSVISPPEDAEYSDSVLTLNAPDYDGEYNTEDYVLGGGGRTAEARANVYPNYSSLNEGMAQGGSSDEAELASDDALKTEYPEAMNFYDVLNNQLKDSNETLGASLVRMTVNGEADPNGVVHPADSGYTLYSVNIGYDYLAMESRSTEAYVWIKGTENDQIAGMPSYEKGDEILTCLYLRGDGCITAVDELLYDVYSLSGLDLAYHRVYEAVNPGNTDMGILEPEREYITTTENNPALYVHKASVKELTRYIRRKVVQSEYSFADLDELSAISMGQKEYVPDEIDETVLPEESETIDEEPALESVKVSAYDDWMEITASGERIRLGDEESSSRLKTLFEKSSSGSTSSGMSSTAMFIGGKLTFDSSVVYNGKITEIEISNAGCPLDIRFRGVAVGDSLDAAKQALTIDKNLSENCTITVKSETVNVVLTFEHGVLIKLHIK